MRSHYCGQVNESLIGQQIGVAGWVHRRRDHGGVIFVDLRDREGLLQVVFDPDRKDVFAEAERLRGEFCIRIRGLVRARPGNTANTALASGQVEVLAHEIEILNRSETPPFHHDEVTNEELRLKYRYLDLRRDVMQKRLLLRHQVTRAMRTWLDDNGFVDIETPMLTKATPEGARDYLVPSRTHAGQFFALPQSPQIFKQLLMMSGFDRYYQIVRCFRDEDLRAERQPEFTQLDIETSFLGQEQIIQMMEELLRYVFKAVLAVDLPNPFPRMSYAEAMRRYASDKPDLRIPLELVDIADLVRDSQFKVFAGPAADPKGRVAALRVPEGGTKMTRKELDDLTPFVARYGAKGLAYVKVNEKAKGRDGLQSPILKFLSDDAISGILSAHRRSRRRPDFLRRGQRESRQRRDGRTAPEARQRSRPGADRLAAAVGRRLPDVRMGWGREALGRHASSVHLAARSGRRRAARGSGERGRERLRHRAERLGDRRRLGAYPSPGNAVDGVRPARHRRGRGAEEIRLPARSACATARRRTAASRSASTAS